MSLKLKVNGIIISSKVYYNRLTNFHVESDHSLGLELTSNISRESHLGLCALSHVSKIGSPTSDRTSCAFHCHGVVNKLFQPFVVRLDVRADYCEVRHAIR